MEKYFVILEFTRCDASPQVLHQDCNQDERLAQGHRSSHLEPPLNTNTTPSVNIITHLDSEVPRVGGDVCHAADELVTPGAGSQWLEGHVVAPADHLEEGGQVMKAVLPPPLHPQKEIDLHRGHRKLVFRGGYS